MPAALVCSSTCGAVEAEADGVQSGPPSQAEMAYMCVRGASRWSVVASPRRREMGAAEPDSAQRVGDP